jgi:hypothetical protein
VVGFEGSLGDEHALRERSVRQALRNQGKRFLLTLGELGGSGSCMNEVPIWRGT